MHLVGWQFLCKKSIFFFFFHTIWKKRFSSSNVYFDKKAPYFYFLFHFVLGKMYKYSFQHMQVCTDFLSVCLFVCVYAHTFCGCIVKWLEYYCSDHKTQVQYVTKVNVTPWNQSGKTTPVPEDHITSHLSEDKIIPKL